jgi:RNA recognition motif-containing protein
VRLFVGGVAPDLNPHDVENFFEEIGPVLDCHMPTDDNSNYRGFAFITMYAEHAEEALRTLNGSNLGGQFLKISEATPRPDDTCKFPLRENEQVSSPEINITN